MKKDDEIKALEKEVEELKTIINRLRNPEKEKENYINEWLKNVEVKNEKN